MKLGYSGIAAAPDSRRAFFSVRQGAFLHVCLKNYIATIVAVRQHTTNNHVTLVLLTLFTITHNHSLPYLLTIFSTIRISEKFRKFLIEK